MPFDLRFQLAPCGRERASLVGCQAGKRAGLGLRSWKNRKCVEKDEAETGCMYVRMRPVAAPRSRVWLVTFVVLVTGLGGCVGKARSASTQTLSREQISDASRIQEVPGSVLRRIRGAYSRTRSARRRPCKSLEGEAQVARQDAAIDLVAMERMDRYRGGKVVD